MVVIQSLPIERTGLPMVVIQSQIRIPGRFSASLTIAESGILGDLLALLVQSPVDFHDTRRND